MTLYRRYRPLFTGLLSGYSLGVGVSFAVDVLWFMGRGHWIHFVLRRLVIFEKIWLLANGVDAVCPKCRCS